MRYLLVVMCISVGLSACQDTTAEGPPPVFSPGVQAYFEKYMGEYNPILFVVSVDGQTARYTFCPAYGDYCRPLSGETKAKALEDCAKDSGGVQCKVYAEGRRIVWKGTPVPSSPTVSKADKETCELATKSEFRAGESLVILGWDDQPPYRKYADEAKGRGLTLEDCSKILGWQISQPKVNQPGSLPAEEGDIEERLTKLKNLYDSGLITQEEYEYKQREILEGL